MARSFEIVPPSGGVGSRFVRNAIIGLILFVLVIIGGPIKVVPAGHVGVKDLFGRVSPNVLLPGINLVIPFTRVIKMSIQTQEVKETAEVPSKEGLMMELEGSLLYRLDPAKAAEVYRTVGRNYQEIVVYPQIRSAIREVTASYDAKALYSSEREQIARETFDLFQKMDKGRGIIAEAVLLRKIGLPPIVANAIQEKLKREQEAEQMKFVLQKESQEAERKRIEAQGISDFQKIVGQGLSSQYLEWKGIEATKELANSPNAKVVVVGNPKSGLPIILGGQ
jgi:regulator of protease activity HflC (stomatin/prohibitin superfamily)